MSVWLESVSLTCRLQPATKYYFVLKTVTYPHFGAFGYQLNTLFSDPTPEVSATTGAAVVSPAQLMVTAFPRGIVQGAGTAGGTDSYTVANIGGSPATVTLTQTGSFFTQSPVSFTLAPGESQTLEIPAVPAGQYRMWCDVEGHAEAGMTGTLVVQ